MMIVEQTMGCLLQFHFVQHKSHRNRPGLKPGPPRGQPVPIRLSYGTATAGVTSRAINITVTKYHSVQNLLSSRLLSKNIKVRICKNIILPVVLYGCETWSLTVREEHKLKVIENKVLRAYLEQKWTE
jgi:hypothetical protein